jgi:hypothetical protein
MTSFRALASWLIPALTTVLTVIFFYLLEGRSPWVIHPTALKATPTGTIVAIVIILLAPAGVLTYAILAYRAERRARRSPP